MSCENYCKNGGTCVSSSSGNSACYCLSGWTGPTCNDGRK